MAQPCAWVAIVGDEEGPRMAVLAWTETEALRTAETLGNDPGLQGISMTRVVPLSRGPEEFYLFIEREDALEGTVSCKVHEPGACPGLGKCDHCFLEVL